MRTPTLFVLVVLAIAFVGFGDRFLPGAAGNASAQTRAKLNSILSGIFPDGKVDDPHERTEKAVKKFEHGVKTEPGSQTVKDPAATLGIEYKDDKSK
ncbi:hypothetical protein KR51_00014700 [Rubidibacter lacunae KORDI 51-2]|uniref:Uncharacterized protein n=1 Tax=Rubidibacter lacunae KORDI 51-2 TaxID=582515 RepID=U5DMU1_9CHRO|nr:hypothetical protein [Rubidibacter lacunae]ERN41934.1 hypothetical protein KR51_00014700 [Rubidibacter lacunae KORDI 51-2]